MLFIVYQTTNLINNKTYIGAHRTNDLNDGYLGSGKALLRAVKKYGRENFSREVLFIFDNAEDMFTKERELVNEEFIGRGDTYNQIIGGKLGPEEFTSSTKEKQSQSFHSAKEKCSKCGYEAHPSHIKRYHNEKCGDGMDRKTREKIAKANTGFQITEETRKKLSESHKGYIMPDSQKEKIRVASARVRPKGSFQHTDENKKKMSERRKASKASAKCKYCGKEFHPSLISRWHNENCKEAPSKSASQT